MWVLGIIVILIASEVKGDGFVSYNQQTDEYVKMADVLSEFDPTLQLEDIHPNLPIFNLPIFGNFYMAVDGFDGEMGDRRSLRRQSDAKKYSSLCNETLESAFHYDNLTIEYKYVVTNFLYIFHFYGALTMRIDNNSFSSSITKTCTAECNVNYLEVQAFQNYDIQVKTLGSKLNPINWFMKWVLVYGLNHFNTYYIMQVINRQVEDLFMPFISIYCLHENPEL